MPESSRVPERLETKVRGAATWRCPACVPPCSCRGLLAPPPLIRFAIVCGDLVNHVPSMYPDTDPEIRTRQVDDFKVRQGRSSSSA